MGGKVAFKVSYVTENDVTTLHYLQNEIKFKTCLFRQSNQPLRPCILEQLQHNRTLRIPGKSTPQAPQNRISKFAHSG